MNGEEKKFYSLGKFVDLLGTLFFFNFLFQKTANSPRCSTKKNTPILQIPIDPNYLGNNPPLSVISSPPSIDSSPTKILLSFCFCFFFSPLPLPLPLLFFFRDICYIKIL
ncbi:hypothetical protein QBC42DRAFT_271201 [Cladorrhinum samala]|uniref:Transmembrane protein n=1 Tax=Cladorrhinum samala TaxID=585594 RepID=A0AAV9HLZ5_9PEZI|nr:hypothetical protein QBC42DRAFT_271201 [Cladorrhinum samala]